MAYTIKSDYTRVISPKELDDILEEAVDQVDGGKTADQVREEAEAMAQAKIRSYLASDFNITEEFAKQNTDTRNENVLRCLLHIAVYNLHYICNPRDIPEMREKAYQDCIDELKDVRDGKLNFELNFIGQGSGEDGSNSDETPTYPQNIQFSRKFVSKPYADPNIIGEDNIYLTEINPD